MALGHVRGVWANRGHKQGGVVVRLVGDQTKLGSACVLGDFNITRFVEDRNRPGVDTPPMARFLDWLDEE
ncbi:hypothetical protein QJS10_CPA10g01216 [Acorus calamus]|uniref:Uncharacterized protein n=1 Tax=Acorus calamus TaxID=4465 RepID=A0AAV9E5Z3_ACOCL|nr:hypothetical protein QJS10_CPA10g01216 [Acorus calamus]